MVENQPNTKIGPILRRDAGDARPPGFGNSQTEDNDPTGDCASSCNSCEGSSAASCSRGLGHNLTKVSY